MSADARAPVVTRRRQGPHPAWIVAGVTFLTLLGAAGFRATPGVLIVPLQDEFGWIAGHDLRAPSRSTCCCSA